MPLLGGLMRRCRRRGMAAPVLVVGGVLGFLEGDRRGSPGTQKLRVLLAQQANVLAALPKSVHLGARWRAEGDLRRGYREGPFEIDYGAPSTRKRGRQDLVVTNFSFSSRAVGSVREDTNQSIITVMIDSGFDSCMQRRRAHRRRDGKGIENT